MVCFSHTRIAAGVLGLLLALTPAARAEGWGTVKGQVVFDGPVPERAKLVVNKDEKACLKNGPLYSEDYVVNPKTKGVRWVVVWLTDASDPKKPLPIYPALKEVTPKTVELDQPCCQFEPHILAIRQGQTVVAKNSAEVPHNVNVQGGAVNPSLNPILPPGSKVEIPNFVAATTPVQVSCGIHPWMKAYIRVFKNPYFAVTDENGNFEIQHAPAGAYHLVAWQESVGWVAPESKPTKLGMPITIKDGGVTDVKIGMKKGD